jgi:hypothetical protein
MDMYFDSTNRTGYRSSAVQGQATNLYLLSQFRWELFGTLTFRRERLPEHIRVSMFFSLLRKLARNKHVYFPNMIWALRQEVGLGGRYHLHFLLAAMPENAINQTTCDFIEEQWERLHGGIARITLFGSQIEGVSYVTKWPKETIQGSESSDKFGENCDFIFSKSLWAALQSRC